MILIRNQFPGMTAASIAKFELDDDVISLDGRRDPLRTESEIDDEGRIRVRIRRSTSSVAETAMSSSIGLTPRASNLSNAEIFSVSTPVPHPYSSPRFSGYASSDAYSLQPTPRPSNFNELDAATSAANTPTWSRSPVAGKMFRQDGGGGDRLGGSKDVIGAYHTY